MKKFRVISTLALLALLLSRCITIAPVAKNASTKSSPFRQMNFQNLIDRYMQKSESNNIEGVYAVSGVVIKKNKNLFGDLKEKTTDRKENYATVAILRQSTDENDFIELSLNKKDQTSYSIIGEFKRATGNLLVYKHFDTKGKESSFTFTADEKGEILEGIRVDDEGGKQVTYKLTYVKLKAR